jgi:galactonate dehydratase
MATIQDVHWYTLRISPKTVWSFVELVDENGLRGVGEATLGRREVAMKQALAQYREVVLGRAPHEADLAPSVERAATLPQLAVLSALDQALWDLAGRQASRPVAALLGLPLRERIPMYANVNRGIRERTPAGFSAQAARAVAAGFTAVKIAPFDEVTLRGDNASAIDVAALDAGLARIAAVRETIGPSARLMVDCHWRLNDIAARIVLKEMQPLCLHWLECPLPEEHANIPRIRRIRSQANDLGIKLAGCEEASRVGGFLPFLDAGAYDVMMPDAKYVGGLKEMLRVAERLASHGVSFSPHNPSGPVCHAASLHVCAVAPGFDRLELQFDETPLFNRLVDHGLPQGQAAEVAVPTGPGLGVSLSPSQVAVLHVEDPQWATA